MRRGFLACISVGIRSLSFVEWLYFISVGVGVLGFALFFGVWQVVADQDARLSWLPLPSFLAGMAVMGLLIALRLDPYSRRQRAWSPAGHQAPDEH